MTKDAYYSMCEDLGSEPIPSEIPVEFDDLPSEVQSVFFIYNKLKDDYDYMNGVYLGKHHVGILDIFKILGVKESRYESTFDLISIIDQHRKQALRTKAEGQAAASEAEKASRK